MHPAPPNLYAQWRAQHGFAATLREGSNFPPEKILQAIWQHQRVRREHLRTLDGQPVRILHPGFGSSEGGPDFRAAVVRFGTAPPVSGDVEVDWRDSGWRAHGHDRNPAFAQVILHVVWEGAAAAGRPPTLALRDVLDTPLPELCLQLEHNSVRTLPEAWAGKCCAPLRELPPEAVAGLLRAAAAVRLENKAAQLRARATHVGWEQALWEGLFRALGYKANIWPMQLLAETRPHWRREAASVLKVQARLLGLSGLLPADLPRSHPAADGYLRQLWDEWWREREEFAEWIMPRSLWRFHGLRPANHPQRRLALAAHWLAHQSLGTELQNWCQRPLRAAELLPSLADIFRIHTDDYWSWHWTFRSPRLKQPQTLLGEQRVTDLGINVVLPWLYARAAAGKNAPLAREMQQRYEAWPAAEDNSVLRLARQRLLGRPMRGRGGLDSAAAQQGLLQIVKDYCDHAPATCSGCQFPELVRQWHRQ